MQRVCNLTGYSTIVPILMVLEFRECYFFQVPVNKFSAPPKQVCKGE